MHWLIKFAMRTMMPGGSGLPGIEDCDLDDFIRRIRRDADALYYLGLALGAVVFAFTPLFTIWIPLPAFFLPKKLLARHAEKVIASPIYLVRNAVFLVRLSAGMCWGAHPTVREKFALPAYAPDPGTFRES